MSAVKFASLKSTPVSLDNSTKTEGDHETDTGLSSERSRGKRRQGAVERGESSTFFSMQDLRSNFDPSISTATTTTAAAPTTASGSGTSANASRSVVDHGRLTDS